MKKRFAAAALCLALGLGLLPSPARAAEGDLFPAVTSMPAFTDVSPDGTAGGVWYDYDSVRICVETGLMKGTGTGETFSPGGAITVAEVAMVAARMYSKIEEVPIPQGNTWYDGAFTLLKAYAQEICDLLNQPGYSPEGLEVHSLWPEEEYPSLYKDPAAPATRLDFVTLLGLGAYPGEALNDISRLPDTDDYTVLSFYNAGVVTGTDEYGTFNGDGGLTRAEAAAMVARVVRPELRRVLNLSVPRVPADGAQTAWEDALPPESAGDLMPRLNHVLKRFTSLTGANAQLWMCHDFGLDPESALLYLEGEGAVYAQSLLPFFCYVISENYENTREKKGFSEDDFWNASVTMKENGASYPMPDYMKLNLERVLANYLLVLQGKKDPSDTEVAALRDRLQESPAFQTLDPRALYELAKSSYYACFSMSLDQAEGT